MARKKNKTVAQNKNARIEARYTQGGRRRTETTRRDSGTLRVGVSTDERNNSTFMTISRGDEFIKLTGREALTVLRVLEEHQNGKYFGVANTVWF